MKVSISRHNRVAVSFSFFTENIYELMKLCKYLVALLREGQAQVKCDLVITRARGVKPFSRVTDMMEKNNEN